MTNQNENKSGYLHPITTAVNQLVESFSRFGFTSLTGKEVTTSRENFDELNFPPHHPARDMHDTFWLAHNPEELLRTHTSASQVSHMSHEKEKGYPLKIVVPGRTYRNEATDATHEVQFTQLEGLAVGEPGEFSLGHLKKLLKEVFSEFFDEEIKVRMRPGYFPFVEPGLEVDIFYNNKWMEVLGAGMIHPVVLANAGINPKEKKGFAFGMGVDRLVMVKYGIPDVRLLQSADLRFIHQFEHTVS